MKKLFLLSIIFSLTFLTGCNKNQKKPENIFSSFDNEQFSSTLSLEEGLDLILPTIKEWADDAVLQKLMTNVVDTDNGYKANVYSFESVKNKKTLSVTYNYKHPIDEKIFSGFGSPESWELNNKFNFQEVIWPADTDEETIKEVANDLENSRYNDIENYLNSEKIIELAKKEGLDNFIDKHKNMSVKQNNVWLFEISDGDIEWNVTYFVGKNDSVKYENTFMAKFDPATGNLIKKSIK